MREKSKIVIEKANKVLKRACPWTGSFVIIKDEIVLTFLGAKVL